ncbi:uncharacterized protein LOC126574759 [Anopheles aquasalis]|uniref:uncharacterized protein LOC126574759 n=1 Tax=Anopheles aquasalis TaxID=42839 RepID=UPI00215A0F1B|nr:uncharacterized protein LOC126574759 [Anopheles aquasalis]
MAEREKSSLLSGSELLQHHTSTYEVNAEFTRLVSVEDLDAARQHDLARMKDDLRRLLAQQRVSKSECISEGVWENDNRRVRIVRAEGKWQAFGYEDSSGKYVDSHEALFLMEMNRLIVKWNGVVVSIEQGYTLFLGPAHHSSYLSLEEYQVYSLLNRAGYFVLRYDSDRVVYQLQEMDTLSAEERCVWSNLHEMLHQPNPRETVSEKEKQSNLYETVRNSMLQCKEHICGSAVSLEVAISPQTDETPYEPPPKKPHMEENDCFALVDRFRRMFQRFDIIRSATEEEFSRSDGSNESVPRFTFELFSSDAQGFKKSLPPLPIARILVRKSSEPMPQLRELQRLYDSQKIPVPLMLMLVSDSLSVNCFLYDMSPLRRNIIKLPNDSLGQDSQIVASNSVYRDDNGVQNEH